MTFAESQRLAFDSPSVPATSACDLRRPPKLCSSVPSFAIAAFEMKVADEQKYKLRSETF